MGNESRDLIPVLPSDDNGATSEPNLDDVVQARWCRRCATAVIPIGKGKCPLCGKFTTGNTLRLRDHVRQARLIEIFRAMLTDFLPSNEVERSQVQTLARICEELERGRPGSLEHTRLVKAQRDLVESLNQGLNQRRRTVAYRQGEQQ